MDNRIDFDSPIPLYAQIEKNLKSAINGHEFEAGDIIPSEKELGERFGVSRITVRKALDGLVSEGLLNRSRGKGTFVNAPRFIDETINLQSFAEKTGKSAGVFSTRVLKRELIHASDRIALHMGIAEGDKLLYVQRLRCFNGEPIGLFENYLRESLGLNIRDNFEGSVYALIEGKCGIPIKEAKRELSSILATKEAAAILDLKRPYPLLSLKTYTYDSLSNVIEYSEGVYRTDRYQFVIHQDRLKERTK